MNAGWCAFSVLWPLRAEQSGSLSSSLITKRKKSAHTESSDKLISNNADWWKLVYTYAGPESRRKEEAGLLLSGRTLEPPDTSGCGTLTAHGFLHTGSDIGTGVLNTAPEGSRLTSSRNGLAIKAAVEEHADFHAVARSAEGGECNQRSDCAQEESNDDADFQIRPR